jgi:hypothetical protein
LANLDQLPLMGPLGAGKSILAGKSVKTRAFDPENFDQLIENPSIISKKIRPADELDP